MRQTVRQLAMHVEYTDSLLGTCRGQVEAEYAEFSRGLFWWLNGKGTSTAPSGAKGWGFQTPNQTRPSCG